MPLTLDELFEPCVECSGTGKRAGRARPDVDHAGDAPSALGLDADDCAACGGYGWGELKETGKNLLDFLRIVKRRDLI